ncbi:hypothetical protein TP70_00690 [Staphylococcus microti]|uniref:Phage protein n=1 Tax=Staphylococcus microti TaxID=569857 RepID=A0A0D6XVE0_9STAP|nr:hypothetical protein [Staphylococcus microti]KIX91828.1 hypothetical protein TP70_00690 [Staphylococcus microti]PNZ83535.1 hypothetical protein CD132_02150 [Staphylococcus microti]SUM58400.1 phage protein [Staphylococcus microti]
MKKTNDRIYTLFNRLGSWTMTAFFVIGTIIFILFIAMATVIPEMNRHVYEGKIVEKYHKDDGISTGTTRYIVVKHDHGKTTIENSDILLHGKFNSRDIHDTLREGQTVKVYTIGFESPKFGFHPNLYRIEQSK